MARRPLSRARTSRGRGQYLAGIAAGIALGSAMRRPSQRPMPHLRTFQRALAATRGVVAATILSARIQAHYDTLIAARPRFAHPALRWHLTYQILPGLALYQALKEDAAQRGSTQAAALAETGATLERLDVLGPLLRRTRWLPNAPALIRLTFPPMMKLYPAEGWDIRIEEQSRQRIAFKVSRCFYLDVLTAYGAPELTAHYCQLDDVAYRELPPSVQWERTTTLGRGGPYCDFCWRTVSTEQAPAVSSSAPADLRSQPAG
jgi:L-2-amino-thiazoline-4-carboxylic acid hydrolase-like protein